VKILYRAKLVNYILEAYQENLQTSSSTAKEVSASIDLLQAAQFIADSWRRVSARTIQNCFAPCDFKHSDLEMPNEADSEKGILLVMHHVRNYEPFSCIDNSLQCCNENEDCEEATVEQISAKQQKTSEDRESDERERVNDQDARIFIAGLQLYFMQEGKQ
jgi:hypothetical protein